MSKVCSTTSDECFAERKFERFRLHYVKTLKIVPIQATLESHTLDRTSVSQIATPFARCQTMTIRSV